MTENISPDAVREALRTVDAAPRPSTRVSSAALALASCAWAPAFLALAWASDNGKARMGWGFAGLACTVVLVCVSLVMVSHQRRVARGWRIAPLLGLGMAGAATSPASMLVMRSHPGGWVVALLAVACALFGFVGGRALAEAPDDLGRSTR